MIKLHVSVSDGAKPHEEKTWLYRRDPVDTEIHSYQHGNGFSLWYGDGSSWYGRIYNLTVAPGMDIIWIDVDVDAEVFQKLAAEDGWSEAAPEGKPQYLH